MSWGEEHKLGSPSFPEAPSSLPPAPVHAASLIPPPWLAHSWTLGRGVLSTAPGMVFSPESPPAKLPPTRRAQPPLCLSTSTPAGFQGLWLWPWVCLYSHHPDLGHLRPRLAAVRAPSLASFLPASVCAPPRSPRSSPDGQSCPAITKVLTPHSQGTLRPVLLASCALPSRPCCSLSLCFPQLSLFRCSPYL